VTVVRTSLLACALFLAVHALAPSARPANGAASAAPEATTLDESSCREHGCGCPHERALEACCCTGEDASAVREPVSTARTPSSGVSMEALRSSVHRDLPHAALVPSRCAGNPRSSGGVPPAPVTIVALPSASTIAAVPTGPVAWISEPPPREHAPEPAIPPPRSFARA